MKKIFVWIVLLACCAFSTADNGYRRVKNNRFKTGEKLTYLAHYSFLNAGEAVVHLDPQLYKVNNRVCYRVDVTGKSIGLFGMTMHIDDTWRSFIDTAAMIPHKFYRNIREGNYRKEETVVFDHFKKNAQVKHTTNKNPEKLENYKVPTNVQDIVSGYYFLRTLDFAHLRVNDTIRIDAFFESENYDFRIKYLGKEKVQTKFGRIDAAVVSPIMPANDLFEGKNPIRVWISDDENRVPVKIKAKLFVGAVELDLIKYEGLKQDLIKSKHKSK